MLCRINATPPYRAQACRGEFDLSKSFSSLLFNIHQNRMQQVILTGTLYMIYLFDYSSSTFQTGFIDINLLLPLLFSHLYKSTISQKPLSELYFTKYEILFKLHILFALLLTNKITGTRQNDKKKKKKVQLNQQLGIAKLFLKINTKLHKVNSLQDCVLCYHFTMVLRLTSR